MDEYVQQYFAHLDDGDERRSYRLVHVLVRLVPPAEVAYVVEVAVEMSLAWLQVFFSQTLQHVGGLSQERLQSRTRLCQFVQSVDRQRLGRELVAK